MASVVSIAPQDKQQEVIKKINFNKITEVVANIYNKNEFLLSEEEFKKIIEQEQQYNQIQNQYQNDLQQADIMNKNAQTLKLQRDANEPYYIDY